MFLNKDFKPRAASIEINSNLCKDFRQNRKTMYCRNCSKELPREAEFCFVCGSPVNGAAAASPTIIINQPKQKAVSSSGIIEAFFAVVLLAALAFGGWYYYRQQNKPLFQINKDGTLELNLK